MFKNKEENVAVKEEKQAKKKRSKIIVDILNGNITVSDALYKLKVLLSDLDNKTVNDWIESELTGYKSSEVPEYRKFKGQVFGNIQAGYRLYSNINIPIKSEFKDLMNSSITEDITTAENYSNANDKDKTLGKPVDLVMINQIASLEIDEFTQVIKANIVISPSLFTGIVNTVKKMILDILIDLEKKYGNLDEYYIEFNNKNEKDKVAKTIVNIIKIGNNNKIVNSNIGEDNEN